MARYTRSLRVRRHHILAALVATGLGLGCSDRSPTGGVADPVPLQITVFAAGTPISTLVVEVTASDLTTPLVFNLTITDGVASGTIRIPPGTARTIHVTAFDEVGNVTHEGNVTIDVRPGQNPPVNLPLTPRAGQVPIVVTFGNYSVVVTPAEVTIDLGASTQLQLNVSVTAADGQPVADPQLSWATTNPAVATVSASGLVTGLATGAVTIVASFEGVAGLSTISVTEVTAGGLPPASLITAGGLHSCALTSEGAAYCWGGNGIGQLGDGTTIGRLTARAVIMPAGVTFSSVTAGFAHTCALTPTGLAYCWGWNLDGQLGGTGSLPRIPGAVTMPAEVTFTSVTAGSAHTCGLTLEGLAYCWGDNVDGQLGNGGGADIGTPTAVAMPAGVAFASMTAGTQHTCGLTPAGAAYCWGRGAEGQLGDGGGGADQLTPTAVAMPAGVTFASVTAGGLHTCGLSPEGAAYCWGDNTRGQLGHGGGSTPTAVATPAGVTFASVTAGGFHTCGLTPEGAAYCWGRNSEGQLGDGTGTQQGTPTSVSIPIGVTLASLAVGVYHTCGVTPAGAAYCWGDNANGQLGDGTTSDQLSPVAVVSQ